MEHINFLRRVDSVLGVVLEREKRGLCDVLALFPALPLVFDYANKEGEGQSCYVTSGSQKRLCKWLHFASLQKVVSIR